MPISQDIASYLLTRLHFQIAIDNIDGKVLRGGEQRQDAMLTESGDNEALLIDEAVSHHLAVIALGGTVRGERSVVSGDILLQFLILEEDHEQAMPFVELLEIRQLALHADQAGEVGIEHHE